MIDNLDSGVGASSVDQVSNKKTDDNHIEIWQCGKYCSAAEL